MRSADLHRLCGDAGAAWRSEMEAEMARILAIDDPIERLQAYAELAREGGESLPRPVAGRIAGERAAMERLRAARQRERAAMERLSFRRSVVAWGAVPFAAAVPPMLAVVVNGWGLGNLLAAWPAAMAAVAVAGFCAWMADRAATVDRLVACITGAALASSAAVVFAAVRVGS